MTHVRELVGLDASPAMLGEAAHPVDAGYISARSVRLVQGDLLTHEFPAESFDLVYSIGVLAEHTPFDGRIVAKVCRWLRPGGRFAFSTVHPESWSIRPTFRRKFGRALLPVARGALRRWLRRGLLAGGRYADEEWINECVGGRLSVESLEQLDSEAHLHCLCVAIKQ